MTLVTVPQVNPNDEVTAASVNQGANAVAAVVNGNLDDSNVSTLSGSKISAGTLPGSALDVASNPDTREAETIGDLVASGLIWTGTTGLVGTMTSGVAYINGKRLVITAIPTYTFTASRDTYIYVDATGTVQYNPVSNNASQPSTPANSLLIAKVVTSASNVTSSFDMRTIALNNAWRSWTPTFTNFSLGNGTVDYAKYTVIGKTVHFRIQVTLGTTSAMGSAPYFTTPLNLAAYPSANSNIAGNASMTQTGTAFFIGILRYQAINALTFEAHSVSGSYVRATTVTGVVPFTWANTHVWSAAGSYEAA